VEIANATEAAQDSRIYIELAGRNIEIQLPAGERERLAERETAALIEL
jgi:hypothetical protein